MVLLYFMDGVKYDMMQKHMPFLASLHTKPLMSDFGYSCACHATMYTSRYIEEHGTWYIWKRGNNSPYKWLNYIPGLKYINWLPLKLVLGKITRKLSKNSSYPGVPCLVNLPLKYWPLFETTEDVMWNDKRYKPEIPNLFSIMREKNVKHHVIALHRGTQANDSMYEEYQVDYKNDDFVYFFIGYTDNMMHQYGEWQKESQEYLTKVDRFIKETYEKAKSARPVEDITLIAFSDHGHIDIEEPKIDINDYFKSRGLRVNKYVHLIEANFARFWFRNEKERIEVEQVLAEMKNKGLGFILDKVYKECYHLNVNPKEHGEIVFYLAAPHEFTNTIWGFGKTVKSGHGFEPTLPKHYGIFCSNKKLANNRKFVFLTDVLPSVLASLNIDTSNFQFRGENIVNIDKTAGNGEY